MEPATIDELRKVICLRDLPTEHLQWILEHGQVAEHSDGELIMKTGDPVDEMILVIEGKSHFYMNVNGKLVYYFTFEKRRADRWSRRDASLFPHKKFSRK